MHNNWFSVVYSFIERNRKHVFILVALLILLAMVGVRFVPFDNTLDAMLPDDPVVRQTMGFLREANFADKVVISFERTDQDLAQHDFLALVDEFADSLDSPLITSVTANIVDPGFMDDLAFFFRSAPLILGEQDLARIDARLTPEAVDKALRTRYLQLLKPEGAFMARAIQADPLGLYDIVGKRIQEISSSSGYSAEIEDGHLVSTNGNHVMIILETSVPLTNGEKSRQLLSYIDSQCRRLPDSLKTSIICGHTHTVSNEKVIRKDIRRTLIIASIAFLALFLGYFRDVMAIVIFLVPAASVLISLHLSSWIVEQLSGFIVGMGAVIAGISVDYGIHIYTAIRHSSDPADSVRRVAKPVSLGALTTIAVFVAFFFSHIQGYRQLAWFSIISILLSLACALFVLPQCLRPRSTGETMAARQRTEAGGPKGTHVLVILCFAILLIAAGILSFGISFDSDIAQLDGSEKAIIEDEKHFHEVWGEGETGQAMLVVSAPEYQLAAAADEQLYDKTVGTAGPDRLLSFAMIWPSRQTRKANAERWTSFWKNGREMKLRKLISRKARNYSFSRKAFLPFFENLYNYPDPEKEPEDNLLFNRLKERFVQTRNGEYQFISFFPDKKRNLQAINNLIHSEPNAFIASRRSLSQALSKSVSLEVSFISLVALALILLVAFVFLRERRMACIALVPALYGVVGLLGLMSLLKLSLNISNLIAGIVVVGLCIDYGIFITYAHRHRLNTGTKKAVTLSAATTLIGAGSLLFARHPALFSIGLTLVAGVFSGYVSAMVLVPSLCSLLMPNRRNTELETPHPVNTAAEDVE